MPSLYIFVDGSPKSQGSLKYVGHRNGRPVLVNDSDATSVWRKLIADAARDTVGPGFDPLDVPLILTAHFIMPKPARPKFPVPATKPDVDKLLRAVGDGMKDGGIITDDSRFYNSHGWETYEDAENTPGATIQISWTDAEQKQS